LRKTKYGVLLRNDKNGRLKNPEFALPQKKKNESAYFKKLRKANARVLLRNNKNGRLKKPEFALSQKK